MDGGFFIAACNCMDVSFFLHCPYLYVRRRQKMSRHKITNHGLELYFSLFINFVGNHLFYLNALFLIPRLVLKEVLVIWPFIFWYYTMNHTNKNRFFTHSWNAARIQSASTFITFFHFPFLCLLQVLLTDPARQDGKMKELRRKKKMVVENRTFIRSRSESSLHRLTRLTGLW